ncbi:MAG: HAMP domain-containing protein, partial [Rhodospirillales bacterium]|nr:HAMP domain-containing protein [Rhodospirillales bacterium]
MKISTKLVVMGLLALIGVGLLFLVSYTSRTQIQSAVQIFIDRKEKLASIESMVDAIKDMQLVTMEALSERLHGPIDPTRLQEIGHLSKRLETTAAEVERKLTDPHDKKAYASLGPQVGLTLAAFRGDLLEYVRSVDWDQEKAEAVDNLIDDNAGYLSDGLRHIQERLEKEVTAELTNVHETLDTASTTESGLASIVVLALLGGLLVIGRGITQSLNQLRGAMRQLADGDLDVTIPHQTAIGEVGEMARTVQVFKANAAEKLRLEQEQEEAERLQRDTDAA